jgi:hypothetical protein
MAGTVMTDEQPPTPKAVTMNYTYVTAWRVIGGLHLGTENDPRVLYEDGTCRLTLTTTPDRYLSEVDRGVVAGNLLLRGLFNAAKFPDPVAEITSGVEALCNERQGRGGTPTVLIVEGFGQCPASIEHSNELPGMVLTFDAVDKASIRQAHRDQTEGIKLALAFESDPPSRFKKMAEGIFLKDNAGRTVYSFTFQLNAKGYVSSPLTDEKAACIAKRYAATARAADVASVRRLYAQMAENEDEPLKAFLFGWSALEIFISKAFVGYEESFLLPLLGGTQARLRQRFLVRVRNVMKDKYRLADKFACVSAVLFPDAPEQAAQEDMEKFQRLKNMRDSILHGEAFAESELPIHELSGLLRKYVVAYLAQPASRT